MGLPKIPNAEDIADMTAKAMEPMMLKLTAIEALLAKLVAIEEERERQHTHVCGEKRRVG